MRLRKQTPNLPNIGQSLKKNPFPFDWKVCQPMKYRCLTNMCPTVYVIVHTLTLNKKHYGSCTVKDFVLTVEGRYHYSCYISRHITREARVALFKVYATAPEIGSFSVSGLLCKV